MAYDLLLKNGTVVDGSGAFTRFSRGRRGGRRSNRGKRKNL